ncbi:hypothetical protein [Catenovulum adriaticum]|uniref:Uncharacterized protein n=1 Tax=Catenovulum adriaticum TaxID=2984846 RepID=A0ABY7AJI0_9ALTE|nr:hypothetical protein [Catenovulum sp. TS8]WAJ69742.1 hypothetical protein OLW01_11335 [Catenovulum sp. TS8]
MNKLSDNEINELMLELELAINSGKVTIEEVREIMSIPPRELVIMVKQNG